MSSYARPAGLAAFLGLELALIGVAVRQRRKLAAVLRESGTVFPLLVALLIRSADLLVVTAPPPWYRTPLLLSTALLGMLVVVRWRRLAHVAVWGLALPALGGATRLVISGTEANQHDAHYRVMAARWLRDNTKPTDRIGSWNAGFSVWRLP